jgi:aldehyde:ferredoxin oxidoreductase
MSYGWAGRILRVDLTRGEITKEPFPQEWGARFLGGSGVNDWILWNEVGPEVDPLSAENRLIFGVGPLAGTIVPLGNRTHVTTRSPLTGSFGDSNGGGFWSSRLKFAGYDHIIIQGKAEKPVYLWIDGEEVSLRDAAHLWGQDVYQTNDILKKELGRDVSAACIGPAGENMVRFACIIFDRYRAAAKTGSGCVMGSKNLKAIAVHGSGGIEVAKPKELEHIAAEIRDALDIRISAGVANFAKYGTTGLITSYHALGCLSVRNYQEVVLDAANEVDPDKFLEKYVLRNTSCSMSCPVHCCHWWQIRDGRYGGEVGAKPEFIVMDSMGLHLGVNNLEAILHFQNLINRYGMDSTETGTGIGLLMELWQRGIITREDTFGATFEWGDIEAIEDTVEKIAQRRDIGDLLADGTVAAARKIGRGAESYVCHSKGMTEVEDVRGFPQWALAYAISTRGCDHLKAHGQVDKQFRKDVSERLFGVPDAGVPTSPECKGRSAKYHEDFEAITNSLGGCMFNVLSLSLKRDPRRAMDMGDYAPAFSAATGVEMSREEFMRCGERIVCLEKAFNARLGLTRKDDTLHGRWMYEPCPSGLGEGMKCADYLDRCLDEYYEERGFDVETGLPKREKLMELGLESVAEELGKLGTLR